MGDPNAGYVVRSTVWSNMFEGRFGGVGMTEGVGDQEFGLWHTEMMKGPLRARSPSRRFLGLGRWSTQSLGRRLMMRCRC